MEKNTTFPTGGKVELLKSVENLPYRKRIATAAKLGRYHKKNPQLRAIINDLRKVSCESTPLQTKITSLNASNSKTTN